MTLHITGYKDIKPFNMQGGMGDIFVGYDEISIQKIIVKLARLSFNQQEALHARNSFYLEQEIATSVQHNHILQAITHGEVFYNNENRPYLVYPFIENGSLLKLMETDQPWRNPTWSLSQIGDIIVQAAAGLFHLHTHYNIVHRDVKPENFLWKPERQVSGRRIHIWVSDLGIARLAKDTDHKTHSITGTHGYIAPEQTDGHISVSIDQYALAVVARYLITGFSPQEQDKRTPLTRLNPQRVQSKEIDRVVLKALSSTPEDRFPSVVDFASALKEAIEQQENPVPMPKLKTVFSDIALHRFQEYVPINKTSPTNLSMQHQLHQESISLPFFTLPSPVKIQLPMAPNMLSWSPDGSKLVCSSQLHPPVIVSINTKLQTLPSGQLACWSSDGHSLIISSDPTTSNSLRLWHISTSTEQPLPLFSNNITARTINVLDWSSQELLALWIDSHIGIYHVSAATATAQLIKELAMPHMQWGNNLGTLRWSPDGSLLAIGSIDGALLCWNARTQQPLWSEPPCQQRIYSLTWSADSTTLAVAYRNKRVDMWNVQQASKLGTWEHLPFMPLMLSISPHNQLAIATLHGLFLGALDAPAPQAKLSGQSLVVWSSTMALATLDEKDDTMLVIWNDG